MDNETRRLLAGSNGRYAPTNRFENNLNGIEI